MFGICLAGGGIRIQLILLRFQDMSIQFGQSGRLEVMRTQGPNKEDYIAEMKKITETVGPGHGNSSGRTFVLVVMPEKYAFHCVVCVYTLYVHSTHSTRMPFALHSYKHTWIPSCALHVHLLPSFAKRPQWHAFTRWAFSSLHTSRPPLRSPCTTICPALLCVPI